MLYGHMEMVDNRLATLVSSADSFAEYDAFLEVVRGQDINKRNFVEVYTSRALQHMTEELYNGYKKPIHVFYHSSEKQRDDFVAEWKIKILANGVQTRDKQADMIFEEKLKAENEAKAKRDAAMEAAEKAGQEYTGERERTLAEIHGLEENDPWDRRSEEELEMDREMREAMRKAKAAGTMSDDSFTSPPTPSAEPDKMKPGAGKLTITDTDAILNSDGSLNISQIRAVKTGGPVDENLKKARQEAHDQAREEKLAGRRTFSPEDFAAVLAGDGSADHLGIRGDRDIRNGTKPIDRPSLSKDAEEARQQIKSAEEKAMAQTQAENDFKAKQNRDLGQFKGTDLYGDNDTRLVDLEADVLAELSKLGYNDATVPVKDYPFDSQLGGKSIIPFNAYGALSGSEQSMTTSIAGLVNATVEGTINMGDAIAGVVTRKDETQDGWIVIQRAGGHLDGVETSLIRIR